MKLHLKKIIIGATLLLSNSIMANSSLINFQNDYSCRYNGSDRVLYFQNYGTKLKYVIGSKISEWPCNSNANNVVCTSVGVSFGKRNITKSVVRISDEGSKDILFTLVDNGDNGMTCVQVIN